MNTDRNKRITIGVIAFLILVIVLLIGIVIGQRSRLSQSEDQGTTTEINEDSNTSEDDGTDNVSEEEDGNSGAASAESEKSNDAKPSDAQGAPVYSITRDSSASWEQDGKYVTQFDIELKNNSSEAIKDWKITFDNVKDAEVLTGWNGKFDIKDGVLTITPESYNGTVDANNVMSCGVQIMFASSEGAGEVSENGRLFLGGQEVDTSKALADSDASNSQDNASGGSGDDGDGGDNAGSSDNADAASKDDASGSKKSNKSESGTPFANHGTLSVKGTDLVDKNGKKYQLKGVSTHGLAWFPDYVNKDAFTTFKDDWGANVVRLAMYTDENGGYCTDGNKDNLKKLVKSGINEATELGMYVIVDWHILHDLTPLKYEDEAKKFFEEISSEYKNSDNIIYEICNEPNGGTSWADVKKYAEDIIPIIRKNDSNAIIVVGTPTWSQDVDAAANDPIKGYDNIMYTLHFYAATHKDDLRNKLSKALDSGLPIFITEFSICEASGNGTVDYDSAKAWFKLINDNNLSYCAWNVSNKDEKSSLIKSSVNKKSGWTEDDLSETGVWIRQQMK